MANRYAVADGNWSNTATWDGGTLPTSADDVYSNNFAVTVDQNIDVISLRSTSAAGISAGGTFTFNTGGVTANISDTIVMGSGVSFILVTASSGLVTINIPNGIVLGVLTNSSTLLSYTGNCNLTITCISFTGNTINTDGPTIHMLSKTSTGTLTFNGNIFGRASGASSGYILFLNSSSINIINGNVVGGLGVGVGSQAIRLNAGSLNITGNVTGGIGSQSIAIVNLSAGPMNITGNVFGTVVAGVSSIGVLNITGTITGGTSNAVAGVIVAGGSINHIGVCQAGSGGCAIFCNNNIPLVTLTGPFLRNGFIVAVVSQTLRINALYNPYFEFKKSDGTDVSYIESGVGFPTELDVRDGTSYASGLYTGTLAVPDPSNVRKGVSTDDTVGTADLTAEDMWNYLTSNTFDSGSMGERMKNVSTVASTGAQIAGF